MWLLKCCWLCHLLKCTCTSSCGLAVVCSTLQVLQEGFGRDELCCLWKWRLPCRSNPCLWTGEADVSMTVCLCVCVCVRVCVCLCVCVTFEPFIVIKLSQSGIETYQRTTPLIEALKHKASNTMRQTDCALYDIQLGTVRLDQCLIVWVQHTLISSPVGFSLNLKY